jgi:hypothetical protein
MSHDYFPEQLVAMNGLQFLQAAVALPEQSGMAR